MPVLIQVQKRDGRIVSFNLEKITNAIFAAASAVGGRDRAKAEELSHFVLVELEKQFPNQIPNVEQIQDVVEKVLIEQGHAKTAKAYILYRQKHRELREANKAFDWTTLPEKDRKPFEELNKMFEYESKLSKIMGMETIVDYKTALFSLKKMQYTKEIPIHAENNYLGGSELGKSIYEKKYYMKNLDGQQIDQRPEDVFARIAAFVATMEVTEKKQLFWATQFYDLLYQGYFLPGGRVIAGAGDLYRLKTLANCFVSVIGEDDLEAIYKTASECARTYSYGGGIGVDISNLRPSGSIVHNAADNSTGSVSFMEVFSLTTGLIGQSGRRGALMLTLDVKHPDVLHFIKVKKTSNWVTKQIVDQCKWSNKFTDEQLQEIERKVRENTQVRFANISLKVSDEFMRAVEEQNTFGKNALLVYHKKPGPVPAIVQDKDHHFSYGIPAKNIQDYTLLENFDDFKALTKWLMDKYQVTVALDDLMDSHKRNVFGDYVITVLDREEELAVKFSGDFMLYFNSVPSGELRHLVKAREVWDLFVEGNYRTAEPGLIFWSTMTKYSPSNYVGKPICSTNPCGEIPLEDGGACNLGSINLSRLVLNGYTENARLDWDRLREVTQSCIRFLDNVVSWNQILNPLEKQRKSARETRRIGLGVMGIADLLNQLGLGYDSNTGLELMEKIMSFIANEAYKASSFLAEEKGASPVYSWEPYSKGAFFQECLTEETRQQVKEKGLRNIAVLSIAPTGSISNAVLGFQNGSRNYIGVSSGIEPIFSLYYTRRTESFGNKFFRVFHSTVQACLDLKGLTNQVQSLNESDLTNMLPDYFFRTAHVINPSQRVRIQGICQKYIDHSISSTVNLSEDIHPEIISNVYLDAWKHGLKGITVYREGSRYPILSTEQKKSVFQDIKDKTFKITLANGEIRLVKGDDVIAKADGTLTTVYHEMTSPQKEFGKQEVNSYAETRLY